MGSLAGSGQQEHDGSGSLLPSVNRLLGARVEAGSPRVWRLLESSSRAVVSSGAAVGLGLLQDSARAMG